MKILAIETSCDETAIALLEASGGMSAPKFKILKEAIASQIEIHRPFGGVVPNLAKREHLKNLPILYGQIFGNSKSQNTNHRRTGNPKFKIQDVDMIAVTVGPGLEPALWAGIVYAQELAAAHKKPLIGVNHLEGHLYSFLLPQKGASSRSRNTNRKRSGSGNLNSVFPAIQLLVSGGHTVLISMRDLTAWKRLGETRDDAVGEAFDKVARLLRLPYPGGPEIQKLAAQGNPAAVPFPRPMLDQKNYDFSFSGLKTSVLYYLRDANLLMHPNDANGKLNSHVPVRQDFRMQADVAASFTAAAIEVLVRKTMRAAREAGARSVMLSGGVAANRDLRKALASACRKQGSRFLVSDMKYNTDNAVMIAAAGYIGFLRKKRYKLEANGTLDV